MSDDLHSKEPSHAAEETTKDSFRSFTQDLRKPIKARRSSRSRSILLWLCALVLLSGAVWGITIITRKVIEVGFSNVWLTNRPTEEVASVRIVTRDGEMVTLTREEDGFSALEIPRAVLSQRDCSAAFSNAAELLAEKKASDGASDLPGYGLTAPTSTVYISFTDGESFVLEIGDRAPGSNLYYAREAGGETIYLIKGLLVNLYAQGVAPYRDLNAFSVDTTMAVSLSIERAGEPDIVMDYKRKIEGFRFTQWRMIEPFYSDVITQKAEDIMAAMNDIRLMRYVTSTKELEPYGLELPDTTMRLINEDGTSFALQIGARDAMGNAYIRIEGSDDIYQAFADSVGFTSALAIPQLIPEYANMQALANVTTLHVRWGGETAEFKLNRTGRELSVTHGDAAIDVEAFKTFFQALNEVTTADIILGQIIAPDAQTILALTYTFADGESALVEYLDFSINDYAVRKNGVTGVSVRKDSLDAVIRLLKAIH